MDPTYRWFFEDEVTSTSDFLKGLIEKKKILDPSVLVAGSQTAGKGTYGRTWLDDRDSCLKASFFLPLKKRLFDPSFLSPFTGVQCCRALKASGHKNVSLKWPNDILIDGLKGGGILIEKISLEPKDFVIIGIGLNLRPSPKIEQELGKKIGTLNEKIGWIRQTREDIMLKFAANLMSICQLCNKSLDEEIINQWTHYDEYFGKKVTLKTSGDEPPVIGIDRGIDKKGALLLEIDGETRAFSIGEVSIKPWEVVS